MGKRDDKAPRQTREFDAGRLAALTKQPLPDESGSSKTPAESVQEEDAPAISIGRATTVHDPMTTGLLAEVARRSQTTEFDDETIEEVLGQIDLGETNHPHTLRRTK